MRIQTSGFLFALSEALDCVERDLLGVTADHSKRVALVSARICAKFGMSAEDIFDMTSCAVLHDNALTQYMLQNGAKGMAHLENMAVHCSQGEDNVRGFPFQGQTAGIILCHHENWDGSGFFGRRENEIPLRAAILRLADNVDLRFAMSGNEENLLEKIPAHVQKARGRLYAPLVVDAFLELLDEGCLKQMGAAEIDAALKAATPNMGEDLDIPEFMRACSLFSAVIDAKSPFTLNHSRGIANKAATMAKTYDFDPLHAGELVVAAHLHDVGKLATPSAILEKPGPLTDAEFNVMRRHVRMTGEILAKVPGLEKITRWAGSHHEKLDGSGYPFGREADELSFECRLLGCIDIYQALTEDRPYRAGMDHEAAIAILQSMARAGKIDQEISHDLDLVFSRKKPRH